MELMEAILTRRSARDFLDEPLTEAEVERLIRAASAAPSAGDKQTWQFIVVRDRAQISALADYLPYAKFAPRGGTPIILCGEEGDEKYEGLIIQNCSAAIQNMLLAAHGTGLGACWCGVYPIGRFVRHLARMFSLPDHVFPVGMVVAGHPRSLLEPADRFKGEKIHYDRWQGVKE